MKLRDLILIIKSVYEGFYVIYGIVLVKRAWTMSYIKTIKINKKPGPAKIVIVKCINKKITIIYNVR